MRCSRCKRSANVASQRTASEPRWPAAPRRWRRQCCAARERAASSSRRAWQRWRNAPSPTGPQKVRAATHARCQVLLTAWHGSPDARFLSLPAPFLWFAQRTAGRRCAAATPLLRARWAAPPSSSARCCRTAWRRWRRRCRRRGGRARGWSRCTSRCRLRTARPRTPTPLTASSSTRRCRLQTERRRELAAAVATQLRSARLALRFHAHSA